VQYSSTFNTRIVDLFFVLNFDELISHMISKVKCLMWNANTSHQ